MSGTSRTPIYRQIAAALCAVLMVASSLPAHAQYRGRGGSRGGGYHGRPAPHYNRGGYGYRGDYRRRGGGGGNVIAGALLGVVAGAAIAGAANNNQPPPPAGVVYSNAPPPPPGVYYNDN